MQLLLDEHLFQTFDLVFFYLLLLQLLSLSFARPNTTFIDPVTSPLATSICSIVLSDFKASITAFLPSIISSLIVSDKLSFDYYYFFFELLFLLFIIFSMLYIFILNIFFCFSHTITSLNYKIFFIM